MNNMLYIIALYSGLLKWGYPKSWTVKQMEIPICKWMINHQVIWCTIRL